MKFIPQAKRLLNPEEKAKFIDFLGKILYFDLYIIEVFSRSSQTKEQLYYCIVLFRTFLSGNSQFIRKDLLFQTLTFFEKIQLPETQEFFLIRKFIFLELYRNQTFPFLEIKSQKVQEYYIKITQTSDKKSIGFSVQEYVLQHVQQSFPDGSFGLLLGKLQNQIHSWKGREYHANHQICFIFSELNKPKYLAEVFAVISYQINVFMSPKLCRQFYYAFHIVRKNQKLQEKFFYELLKLHERTKMKERNDINLMAIIFCLLDFKQELLKQPNLWRKLLIEVYLLSIKFLSMDELDRNIVELYEFKLYLFSIVYLNRLKIKKRKVNNLFRKMIKKKNKQHFINEELIIEERNFANNLKISPLINKKDSKNNKNTKKYEYLQQKYERYRRISDEQTKNFQGKQLKSNQQRSQNTQNHLNQYIPFEVFKEVFLKEDLKKDMDIINKVMLENSLREFYKIDFRGIQTQLSEIKQYLYQMIKFGKEMGNNDTFKEAVSLMGELLCQEKKNVQWRNSTTKVYLKKDLEYIL